MSVYLFFVGCLVDARVEIAWPLPFSLVAASPSLALVLSDPLPASGTGFPMYLASVEDSRSASNYDIPPTPRAWSRFIGCLDSACNDVGLDAARAWFAKKRHAPLPVLAISYVSNCSAHNLNFDLPVELLPGHFYTVSLIELDAFGAESHVTPRQRVTFAVESLPSYVELQAIQADMRAKRELLQADFSRRLDRSERVCAEYVPLDSTLFGFNATRIFVPSFLEALNNKRVDAVVRQEAASGVFSLDLLQSEFCTALLREVENFERYPHLIHRPNSMNKYGAVLDDFGFQPLFTDMLAFMRPLFSSLFGERGGGELDSHHAFVVKYEMSKDESLDVHMDQSEVTLNVCLGKQFDGGAVFFAGARDTLYERNETFEFQHRPGGGNAIVHVGQHWHGARRLRSGQRYNLILWGRSSDYHRSSTERFLSVYMRDMFGEFEECFASH